MKDLVDLQVAGADSGVEGALTALLGTSGAISEEGSGADHQADSEGDQEVSEVVLTVNILTIIPLTKKACCNVIVKM